MNKGKLLLTSTGLSCENVAKEFEKIVADFENKNIAIITTAAEGKENNIYSQSAQKQFIEMGFTHVDFIDLESDPLKDLSKYGIIYVCGGNTFKLLKFTKEANFKSSILDLLGRGGLYVGVSAGSIIVGPSIAIAGEVEPDPNEIGLVDLTGFNITNLIVLPHYSPELENDIQVFEKKYGVTVERITNSQAVFIQDEQKSIIQ